MQLHRPSSSSLLLCLLVGVVLLALASPASGTSSATLDVSLAEPSGLYVEARTADIYTGPCFANAEVNLAGREAVLAWRVDRGGFDEVDLSGLSVAAVVQARATLGDPFAEGLAPRALLLVDGTANERQRDALVRFAQSRAGDLLESVVAIEAVPIELVEIALSETVEPRQRAHGHHALGELAGAPPAIALRAGDHLRLRTRALHAGDHLCGNETVYYPPLVEGVDAQPAVTLEHRFDGEQLGRRWSSPNKRSAFVGSFGD